MGKWCPEEESKAKAMFLIRFLFIQNGFIDGPFATPTCVLMKRFECQCLNTEHRIL